MMLTPDAVLRGETIDNVLERVVSRIKPPLAADDLETPAATNGDSAADGGKTTAATQPRRRRSRAEGAATK